jgi:hypothetical protein
MDYTNRTYAFTNTSDIGSVDFTQVMETSSETVRKSVDGSQFILKWYTDHTPTFITDESVSLTWSGSHADCLIELSSEFWSPTGSI